ncbi:MAG: hypothetical protein HYZ50_20200 [Deltaproteobacteria bacterium]|nr:hypothetical protein [Deltaproteobacteria bacterium]
MAMNTELEALQHVLADPAHGYFFDRWRAAKFPTEVRTQRSLTVRGWT